MARLTLLGNIASRGVYCNKELVPEGMACFRGPTRIFRSFAEAARAVEKGEAVPGNAFAVFPEGDGAGAPAPLEKAVRNAGLEGRFCLITDEDPHILQRDATVFFYGSKEARLASSAGILAEGDVLEYDLLKGSFNADVTEEGAARRAAGGDPDSLTVTELAPGTWALTERYSRMFLLKGREKNLLIDTAFGLSDVKETASKLAGDIDLVFLTHGHWDHLGGASKFDRVYMNRADMPLIPEDCENIRVCDLEPGSEVDLGGRHIEVIGCPGHTPGGLCFLDRENRMLFAGDSVAEGPTYLFLDHCSADALLGSLRKLLARRSEYDVIFSAHRKMALDAGWIEDMIECVEKTLAGELAGVPACVARTAGESKKYSYGKVSVFLP